jgi:hypothetical protein
MYVAVVLFSTWCAVFAFRSADALPKHYSFDFNVNGEIHLTGTFAFLQRLETIPLSVQMLLWYSTTT